MRCCTLAWLVLLVYYKGWKAVDAQPHELFLIRLGKTINFNTDNIQSRTFECISFVDEVQEFHGKVGSRTVTKLVGGGTSGGKTQGESLAAP